MAVSYTGIANAPPLQGVSVGKFSKKERLFQKREAFLKGIGFSKMERLFQKGKNFQKFLGIGGKLIRGF